MSLVTLEAQARIVSMKKLSLILSCVLMVGCSTVLQVGDKVERAITPPDAVNFFITQPDGSFKSVINDSRIARKVEVTATRKSKTANGFTQVQFDSAKYILFGSDSKSELRIFKCGRCGR
jgi:PBP1b-binding outer membrane lipoprotein LpoB